MTPTGSGSIGRGGESERPRRGWGTRLQGLTAVAVLLGFLVVMQFRAQQADGGLGGLTSQELTLLVANLSNRNDQLRSEVAALEGDLRALDAAQQRGQSSVEQIRRDLYRVRAWAGLDPVVGAGVRLRASGSVSAPAVEEILNELRNAGAEAIAVGGVRVVWGTVVSEVDGRLTVEGVPLTGTVEMLAIGNPEILTGSLTRIGGVISLLGAMSPEVDISVEPLDGIRIPATTRDLSPAHGSPRL